VTPGKLVHHSSRFPPCRSEGQHEALHAHFHYMHCMTPPEANPERCKRTGAA
jgi:hypothetical protein